MVRKEWQKKAYLEAHDNLKKTLIEAEKGMTKTELHQATGLARTTIDRHLSVLENVPKQVQKFGKRYFWGDKYNALVKGLKEDAALVEELDVLVNRSKELINKMARPENLRKWRQNGVFIPSEETFKKGYLTPEEVTGLLEHKEKMFGGLRRAFVDLARVLVKVEGFANVQDNLSNVTFTFINGHPLPNVTSKFKDGRGMYHLTPELVEVEELNTRLAEETRKRTEKQDPPLCVLVKDGNREIVVEKSIVDEAARSGKTIKEVLEADTKKATEKFRYTDGGDSLREAIELQRIRFGFTGKRRRKSEGDKK